MKWRVAHAFFGRRISTVFYLPVLPNMGMYALLTHDICMDAGLQKARRRLQSQPNLVSRIQRSSFHFSFALEVVVINLPDSNTFIISLQ